MAEGKFRITLLSYSGPPFPISERFTGCPLRVDILRRIILSSSFVGVMRKSPSLVGLAVILRILGGYSFSKASTAWYAVGKCSPHAFIRNMPSAFDDELFCLALGLFIGVLIAEDVESRNSFATDVCLSTVTKVPLMSVSLISIDASFPGFPPIQLVSCSAVLAGEFPPIVPCDVATSSLPSPSALGPASWLVWISSSGEGLFFISCRFKL